MFEKALNRSKEQKFNRVADRVVKSIPTGSGYHVTAKNVVNGIERLKRLQLEIPDLIKNLESLLEIKTLSEIPKGITSSIDRLAYAKLVLSSEGIRYYADKSKTGNVSLKPTVTSAKLVRTLKDLSDSTRQTKGKYPQTRYVFEKAAEPKA